MACFTVVEVTIEDTLINRKARKALGLKEDGPLTTREAALVRNEVAVLTSIAKVKRLQPTAIITRKGNKLTVKVSV